MDVPSDANGTAPHCPRHPCQKSTGPTRRACAQAANPCTCPCDCFLTPQSLMLPFKLATFRPVARACVVRQFVGGGGCGVASLGRALSCLPTRGIPRSPVPRPRTSSRIIELAQALTCSLTHSHIINYPLLRSITDLLLQIRRDALQCGGERLDRAQMLQWAHQALVCSVEDVPRRFARVRQRDRAPHVRTLGSNSFGMSSRGQHAPTPQGRQAQAQAGRPAGWAGEGRTKRKQDGKERATNMPSQRACANHQADGVHGKPGHVPAWARRTAFGRTANNQQ
jgi:hypothetical protein